MGSRFLPLKKLTPFPLYPLSRKISITTLNLHPWYEISDEICLIVSETEPIP